MSDQSDIPQLDEGHPLHEDFDFIAFARKNEATLINLKNDARLLATEKFPEVAVLVCAAVTSDKTTISAADLPLPTPTAEPYASRFVSFVERMERYFHCLYLEERGYMKRTDTGFEPTERGKNLVSQGQPNDAGNEDR